MIHTETPPRFEYHQRSPAEVGCVLFPVPAIGEYSILPGTTMVIQPNHSSSGHGDKPDASHPEYLLCSLPFLLSIMSSSPIRLADGTALHVQEGTIPHLVQIRNGNRSGYVLSFLFSFTFINFAIVFLLYGSYLPLIP